MTEHLQALLKRCREQIENTKIGFEPDAGELSALADDIDIALEQPAIGDAVGVAENAIVDFVKELEKHKGKPANRWSDYVAWANVEHIAKNLAALPALSQKPDGWSISKDSIALESEWRDGFNGEHYSYDTGRKTVIVYGLQPEECDEVVKLLTEGRHIPLPTAPKQEG